MARGDGAGTTPFRIPLSDSNTLTKNAGCGFQRLLGQQVAVEEQAVGHDWETGAAQK